MNLFLDDMRVPSDVFIYTREQIYLSDWYIVRNYDEFVEYIKNNDIPHLISFDHDLGKEHYEHQTNINYDDFKEKSGYDCAKWLINYCIDNNLELPQDILIHSMNIIGGDNIQSLFTTYNKVNNKKHMVYRMFYHDFMNENLG